jgi:hypothetical protein
MAHRYDRARFVDQLHDLAAVHVAEGIRVVREHQMVE